jgi:hypothetical protein
MPDLREEITTYECKAAFNAEGQKKCDFYKKRGKDSLEAYPHQDPGLCRWWFEEDCVCTHKRYGHIEDDDD